MKVIRFLDENLEKGLVFFLLAAMSIIISLQVFMRYVVHSSLPWSEEVARYMFIWLVYIGISYGVKTRRHIRVDAAMYIFPKMMRKYITIIGQVLFLIFALVIVKNSIEVSGQIFELSQTSPAIGLPMGYVYLAPLIGFVLVSVRLIQNLYFDIKSITKGETL